MDTSWSILGLVVWGGGKEPKFWVNPFMGLWIGVGVMEEEPKFGVDPTMCHGQFLGWWCGVEVMEEEPKFWMDPWTYQGRFLGLWSGGEVRNPNSTPPSIPIWSNPNFGWIHGHIMVDSWGYGVGWRRGTQILGGSIHGFVDWGGDDGGGTQILGGSNQVPWSILGFVVWGGGDGGGTQILGGSMDTSWLILGVMEWDGAEEHKFWVDPSIGCGLGWR